MNRTKYANSGIPELIITLEEKYKVKRFNMVAKIAGGATCSHLKNNVSCV